MSTVTRVVNIRDLSPGWERDPAYAYIGRAGRGQDGYFGNPHPVGDCARCGREHERGEAVLAFREDFESYLRQPEYLARIKALKGKILVCFCAPRACHGHVMAEWLNKQP